MLSKSQNKVIKIIISVLEGKLSFSKSLVTFLNLSESHSFQYSSILPTCAF